jgi:uncharacterized protein (TIGR03437 family)
LTGREVGFEIGPYDRQKALIVDPVLVVNAGFGGSGIAFDFPGLHGSLNDTGTGIATDSGGNIYVTGTTFSTNFPLLNSLQGAPSQGCSSNCSFSSVFVTKLSPDGSTLLFSTYIGAPSAATQSFGSAALLPASIAAGPGGTVYVTGTTAGVNFPGITTTAGGNDAFLLRLNPQGEFLGTLLFGGSGDDAGTSVVLGADGYIYLAGTTQSSNFPVTQNAYRATSPGPGSVFLVKLGFTSAFGPTNGTVIYSTYVGPGTSAAIAADSGGNAYIAAGTTSASWPTTSGAAQLTCAGATCADIAVAKLDPLGQKLIYGTYLGGSEAETLGGIAVDASGGAYIAGATNSADFPVTAGALETSSNVDFPYPYSTGFVAKLSPDAAKFAYATYLGGSASDRANAIAVDASGNAYVGGATTSPDFPLFQALQSTPLNSICGAYSPSGSIPQYQYDCASGGFLSVLNPNGTALVWSTYLGSGSVDAVARDSAGNVYATGLSIGVNLPATNGTVGVVKIAPGASALDVPASSIVNAASYAPGLPLPGGLASVFLRGLNLPGTLIAFGSPLPTELAGVTILVGGVPAPILAAAPLPSGLQQINFQVPVQTPSVYPSDPPRPVEIRYQGSSSFAFPQVSPPGIFTLSDGTAAIEHSADYSLVTPSNPAHPGEVILVYATGLGAVSPAAVSGVSASGPAGVAQSCGGLVAFQPAGPYPLGSILYAGLTPGFVGLYQLNIQLAETLPAGTVQFLIEDNICGLLLPASSLQSNTVNLPVQ